MTSQMLLVLTILDDGRERGRWYGSRAAWADEVGHQGDDTELLARLHQHPATRLVRTFATVDEAEGWVSDGKPGSQVVARLIKRGPMALAEAGTALYGEQWKKPLCESLRMNYRQFQRYAAGTQDFPETAFAELAGLCADRARHLARVAERIAAPATQD